MKKQLDIKKLVLLNLPYLLMGLFATNFGEAWRLAQGANASEKFLSLFAVLPGALQSFWPSLHPLDLLVGLCCGAGLRLAVYLKSKNAKKYRHGMEYGSARWGTSEDIAPYIDPVFQNNVILTKTESLGFPIWGDRHSIGAGTGGNWLPGKNKIQQVFQPPRADEPVQRSGGH